MNDKHTMDMTVGSPAKHLLLFALPLLIGNIFQQFYNMVDSIIVGNYVGANALAAVGACGSLNFLFFALSSGLSVGIGIIISQYFGAGKYKQVSETIANAAYVLVSAAIGVSSLGVIFAPAILGLLGTPAEIIGDSIIYMRTTCAGIVGIALYNGVASILRALGDSKTPLYFLIVSSIINVTLDLTFVVVFHMGVFGVALATIIAQAISAITCLIYAYHKVSFFKLTLEQMKPNKAIIARSFKLGVPVAMQSSMIAISCIVLQGVVNSFGATVVASFTITSRIEQLIQQPYGSLGMAMTTYTGQNVGAGKLERVQKGFRQATLVVLIFSLCMVPIFWSLGETIVSIFVKEPEVIEMASKALRITSVCYFGLGMIYAPRGLLNGAGDARFALINGITEVACRVLFSQILIRIAIFGYWSVWITTGVTWCVTGIVCCLRYAQGKWKRLESQI